MVAITIMIARAMIGAFWTDATVFLIIFQQKTEVADAAFCHILRHARTTHNLIEATPFSPESIRALGTVIASCSRRDIFHTMSIQPPQWMMS